VRVIGTTADVGSKEMQVQLSTARAESVARLLVELDVPKTRITASGVGSSFPEYVPDHGPDGQILPGPAQQNRTVRIDFTTA
jgi:outer membrane protein OmpA-like peptidoglycan-associated protein